MNEIQFILYSMPDDEGKVQVVIKDDTLWCTQKGMAQLFGVGVPAISKHLTHIFEEGELEKEVVVSKMEIPTQHGAIEGKTQMSETAFYSLDAINEQDDYAKTRSYWKYLKNKLKQEGNEVVSATNQLKLLAPDAKRRLTDVLDAEGVSMLAKSIPNQRALAQVPYPLPF